MALKVVDTAMQAFGAEGLSQDTPLAQMFAQLRTLRIADVCPLSLPREFAIHILACVGTRCRMSTYLRFLPW